MDIGAPVAGWRRVSRLGRLAAVLFAAAAAISVPGPAASQETGLELRTYRFWRSPDLTLAEVYGIIPLQGLTFSRRAAVDRASYSGVLEVKDSTGLVLKRREWTGSIEVPALSPEARVRATTTEHFSFQLKPGLYILHLAVTDSASGVVHEAEQRVRAEAAVPERSDLVLASALERVEEETAAPAGAMVRGALAVVPNFAGVVTAERPEIGLFAEIYRPEAAPPETATVAVVIEGAGGSVRHTTATRRRVYAGGGSIEALSADLKGLPPGDYHITLRVGFPEDTLVLGHDLAMLPPGAGASELADQLPYEGMSEDELDSIFAPMRYVATPTERATFESLSSADAKRRFLARFWQERAARAGSTADALREEFEERVTFANREFRPARPGQKFQLGWQTDRGRIHITYGPPDERYVESQRQDQTNPWEVWKYIRGRGDKYVFWDRSGFGDFQLVHSTNRDEPGIPSWQRLFTDEALQFIRTF